MVRELKMWGLFATTSTSVSPESLCHQHHKTQTLRPTKSLQSPSYTTVTPSPEDATTADPITRPPQIFISPCTRYVELSRIKELKLSYYLKEAELNFSSLTTSLNMLRRPGFLPAVPGALSASKYIFILSCKPSPFARS